MDRRRFAALIALAAALPGIAAASGKSEKAPARSRYMQVQTLLGTTRRADGRRGSLTVECGLDIADAALRERAEQSLPRLRSAYASTVQAYAAGLPSGTAPNADFIARALQQQTDLVLGRPGARLLLGTILVN